MSWIDNIDGVAALLVMDWNGHQDSGLYTSEGKRIGLVADLTLTHDTSEITRLSLEIVLRSGIGFQSVQEFATSTQQQTKPDMHESDKYERAISAT